MKTRSLKVFFTPRLMQRNFCGEIKNYMYFIVRILYEYFIIASIDQEEVHKE